jgi:ADP-ribosylglycohydrolase
MMLPVALYFADDPERARRDSLEHLALTHPGQEMKLAADAILSLLLPTLRGASLVEVIQEECARQRNPHFGFPFSKWLDLDDEEVLGRRFSTACYVDQAVPSVIYLALKYADCPEEGLVANTNLGGDNVHRGGVLGCLLGAQNRLDAWPERWRKALLAPPVLP